MRLHNQTNEPITWNDGPFNYKWEPFGFAEVDEKAVEHIRAQKVKVDVSPVSPENRARSEAESAQAAALNSDTRKLKQEMLAACADRDSAKAEVERVKVLNASLDKRLAQAESKATEAADKYADASTERDALKAELAGLAVSGVAEADVVVSKVKAQLADALSSLEQARAEAERATKAERDALAKASGAETAALEAMSKGDALKAEVAALKKELASLASKPKK